MLARQLPIQCRNADPEKFCRFFFVAASLRQLNVVLRDHHTGAVSQIDPRLFDILVRLYRTLPPQPLTPELAETAADHLAALVATLQPILEEEGDLA